MVVLQQLQGAGLTTNSVREPGLDIGWHLPRHVPLTQQIWSLCRRAASNNLTLQGVREGAHVGYYGTYRYHLDIGSKDTAEHLKPHTGAAKTSSAAPLCHGLTPKEQLQLLQSGHLNRGLPATTGAGQLAVFQIWIRLDPDSNCHAGSGSVIGIRILKVKLS